VSMPTTCAEFAATHPDIDTLDWFRVTGSPRFDYLIDYEVAVLGVDERAGRIEFLSRWAPHAYCHYHRHLGETSLLVIDGEHHVAETRAHETVHKTRSPGFFATNPGGDVHMEWGGADGALVYFNCRAVEGKLFEVLDRDGTILTTATVEQFLTGGIKGQSRAVRG